jgi:ankyrin repeat protein
VHAVKSGDVREVKRCIASGADVNGKHEENKTALGSSEIDNFFFQEIAKPILEIVKCLVEHGAAINEKDEKNKTALHYAAERGSLENVKYLVEHGADINAKDKKNKTALHYAAICGLSEIVKYLVEHGADEWNSALIRACYRGKTAAVRALMNAKVDIQNVEDLIRRSDEVINTIELDLKKSIKPGQKIRILKAMDNENG